MADDVPTEAHPARRAALLAAGAPVRTSAAQAKSAAVGHALHDYLRLHAWECSTRHARKLAQSAQAIVTPLKNVDRIALDITKNPQHVSAPALDHAAAPHVATVLASAQAKHPSVQHELSRLGLRPAAAEHMGTDALLWTGMPADGVRVLAEREHGPEAYETFGNPVRSGDHSVNVHPGFGSCVGVELHPSSAPDLVPRVKSDKARAALPQRPSSRAKPLPGQGLVAARWVVARSLAQQARLLDSDSKTEGRPWSPHFMPPALQHARIASAMGAIHAFRRANGMPPTLRLQEAAEAYLRGGDSTSVLSVVYQASTTPYGVALSSMPLELLGDGTEEDAEASAPVPMSIRDLVHPADRLAADVGDGGRPVPAPALVSAVSGPLLDESASAQMRVVDTMQTYASKQSSDLREVMSKTRPLAALTALFTCGPRGEVSPWLRHELDAAARGLMAATRTMRQSVHAAAVGSGMSGACLAVMPSVPFGDVLTPNIRRYAALASHARAREQLTDAVRSLHGAGEAAAGRLAALAFMDPNRLPLFLRMLGEEDGRVAVADGMQCEFFCERLVLLAEEMGDRAADTIASGNDLWPILAVAIGSVEAKARYNSAPDAVSRARIALAEVQAERGKVRGRADDDGLASGNPELGQDWASRPLRDMAQRIRAVAQRNLLHYMIRSMRLPPDDVAVAAKRGLGMRATDVAGTLADAAGFYLPPSLVLRGCVEQYKRELQPLTRMEEGFMPATPSLLILVSQEANREKHSPVVMASMAVTVRDLPELARREHRVRARLASELALERFETRDGREPKFMGKPLADATTTAEHIDAIIDDATGQRDSRDTIDRLVGRDDRARAAVHAAATDMVRPIGAQVREIVMERLNDIRLDAQMKQAERIASDLTIEAGGPVLQVEGAKVEGKEAELRHESRGELRAIEPHQTSSAASDAAARGRVGAFGLGFLQGAFDLVSEGPQALQPAREMARAVYETLETHFPGTHSDSGPRLTRDYDS